MLCCVAVRTGHRTIELDLLERTDMGMLKWMMCTKRMEKIGSDDISGKCDKQIRKNEKRDG